MKKSPNLYKLVLSFWLFLMASSLSSFYYIYIKAEQTGLYTGILIGASILFIAYFWLNGAKDLIYTLYYYLFCKKNYYIPRKYSRWNMSSYRKKRPKVVLVYCTYNDFSENSLLESMKHAIKTLKLLFLMILLTLIIRDE